MREYEIKRRTAETDIEMKLSLDGIGESTVDTGCGFLDHMLTLFSKHGRFDIAVTCKGDVNVDYHHTVEDVGICLGKCFRESLGERRGIVRYGDTTLPMDESLILSAVDISGRAMLVYNVGIPAYKVGDFDTELCEEFFLAFVREAQITLHITKLSGTNSHHIIEGIFKSVAHTLGKAVAIDSRFSDEIPSTKGVL